MEKHDLDRLARAVYYLENPTWTATITDIIGMPVEWAIRKLPAKANQIISNATSKAISKAVKVAVLTMNAEHRGAPKKWCHRGAVATSGAIGGFFGLAGLTVELPASTIIMLRSIADVARSQGEDITKVDSQLQCVSVFALGSKSWDDDDASESSYYAIRAVLAKLISEAGSYIAEKGFVEEGAPIIVKFIVRIASRFQGIISEKVATESIPVIGALGGASINLLFMNHFQRVATGHFIIRSLERAYSAEEVKIEYSRIAANQRAPRS
ncbi:MAG: EcsC family protein [Candidatus Zhuqueibacterota bacterium]